MKSSAAFRIPLSPIGLGKWGFRIMPQTADDRKRRYSSLIQGNISDIFLYFVGGNPIIRLNCLVK